MNRRKTFHRQSFSHPATSIPDLDDIALLEGTFEKAQQLLAILTKHARKVIRNKCHKDRSAHQPTPL
jgi:hypothetical protein